MIPWMWMSFGLAPTLVTLGLIITKANGVIAWPWWSWSPFEASVLIVLTWVLWIDLAWLAGLLLVFVLALFAHEKKEK